MEIILDKFAVKRQHEELDKYIHILEAMTVLEFYDKNYLSGDESSRNLEKRRILKCMRTSLDFANTLLDKDGGSEK